VLDSISIGRIHIRKVADDQTADLFSMSKMQHLHSVFLQANATRAFRKIKSLQIHCSCILAELKEVGRIWSQKFRTIASIFSAHEESSKDLRHRFLFPEQMQRLHSIFAE
jgi:hypothetical protein